jgi:hypothetical protein
MRKLGVIATLLFSSFAALGAGCSEPDDVKPDEPIGIEGVAERQQEINVPCPEKTEYCSQACVDNDRIWKGHCSPDDGACVCLPDHSAGPGYDGRIICHYTLVWNSFWGWWEVGSTWCFPAN